MTADRRNHMQSEPNFWKIFYVRRATRILPAYILLIVVAVATVRAAMACTLALFCVLRGELRECVPSGPGRTFGDSLVVGRGGALLFVWPLNVRNLSERTLVVILITVFITEVALRAICLAPQSHFAPLSIFHLDGLVLGSLLSLLLHRPQVASWLSGLSFLIALAACVAMFVRAHEVVGGNLLLPHSAAPSVLALAAALLLAHLTLQQTGIAAKVFSLSPLVFFGRISYGLYLCHMLVRQDMEWLFHHYGYVHNQRIAAASLVVSTLLSWISFEVYGAPLSFPRQTCSRSVQVVEGASPYVSLIVSQIDVATIILGKAT